MATEGVSWVEDMFGLLVHWHEFCRAAAKGQRANRKDQRFVVQHVGHPNNRCVAFVDPDTEHLSIIGEGLYPRIRELQVLASHAFQTDLGAALFPPLVVRTGGSPTPFRWAGHGDIFGFTGSGTAPPRREDPAVVLATLPAGYTLVAIHNRRILLIAQGRLSEIAGLDLDGLDVWERLRNQEDDYGRLQGAGLTRSARGRKALASDTVERRDAALSLALQASILAGIPAGVRGRRDLRTFLAELVVFARFGKPDPVGTPEVIAAQIGKALRQAPRSPRAMYPMLGLLEKHGQSNGKEVLVSRVSPQNWHVHASELVLPDAGICRSVLGRWPALQALVDGSEETVTEDDVQRMRIRGGRGGIVKKRHENAYLFDCGMTQEYELRCKRERELVRLRLRHAEESRGLREELESLRRELEQANAENAARAAYVADSDARILRAQQAMALGVERVAALTAERAMLEGNKRLVRAFVDATNNGDWAAAEVLLGPDFQQHEGAEPQEVRDRSRFLDHLRQVGQLGPDRQVHIGVLIAEGDLVAAHLVAGTSDGASRQRPSIRTYRVRADQIIEIWDP